MRVEFWWAVAMMIGGRKRLAQPVSMPGKILQVLKLARVKDIATVEGIRDDRLVGYGIVVGLQGTGDRVSRPASGRRRDSGAGADGRSLQGNAMASTIRVKNMAAVFLSGTLGRLCASQGSKMDRHGIVGGRRAGASKAASCCSRLSTARMGKSMTQAQGPMVVGGYSVIGRTRNAK